MPANVIFLRLLMGKWRTDREMFFQTSGASCTVLNVGCYGHVCGFLLYYNIENQLESAAVPCWILIRYTKMAA